MAKKTIEMHLRESGQHLLAVFLTAWRLENYNRDPTKQERKQILEDARKYRVSIPPKPKPSYILEFEKALSFEDTSVLPEAAWRAINRGY